MRVKHCTDCGRILRNKNGAPCTELYDEDLYAKSKILKLVGCTGNGSCGLQVADKYVECDGVLLLIDLVLQSKQAYRHVLLNGPAGYTGLVAKMALLTVLCDGYIGWSHDAGTDEFFEREYEFYVTCLKVAIALLGFLATVMTTSRLSSCVGSRDRARTLLFGLLLSYSSRFFNLAALLWSQPRGLAGDGYSSLLASNVMWGFVYLLFTLSSVRVHQVTQETKSAFSSWIQLLMGHFVFVCLLNMDHLLTGEPFICSS